jgi:prenyltransferase beta subunit
MLRLWSIFFVGLASASLAHAGEKANQQTIAYLQKLQTSTGGFLSMAPKPNIRLAPTLRATTTGVRALHHFGGKVPDREAAARFVARCYHADSGGFSDMPGGKSDVFSTAVGLMAVTELKMPAQKYAAAGKFLSANAQSFEDIRIAAAGFEALKKKAPLREKWIAEVVKLRNKDGSYGKGAGLARATGGSVVTLLRLGVKPAHPETILKFLNDGQRQNGGWGKADNAIASDLETTYRVMRCYAMLKAQPKHVEGVRSFIAKCRNADGGYGVAPGQPSSVAGTYFAGITLHWLQPKE